MEKKKKMKMAGSYFFKIICNYVIEDRRLELPKKFVRLFGEELGKAGLIEDPTGKIWPVELRRAKAEIYFQSGWQEFMEYFSISVGHFLIFRYEGDSQFHVSICDETACEIEYPYHGEDVDESVSEGVSLENMDVPFQSAACNARAAANKTRPSCRGHDSASKRRFEDYQEARGSVKRNRSDGIEMNTSKQWVYNFRRQPELPIIISDDESDNDEGYQNPGDSANVTNKTEQDRCKAQFVNSDSECDDERPTPTQQRSASHKGKPKKASCGARKLDVSRTKSQRATRVIGEARAFKSDFPMCMIIMRQSYLSKGSPVYVPSEFTREFLIKAGDNFVTLQDPAGKKWRVGYKFRKAGTRSSAIKTAELYKGWYRFVLENHLKVGDACVFELVDIDNLEMKVNIIRVCVPCGKRHPEVVDTESSEENYQIPGKSAKHNDSEDIESDAGHTMPIQPKSARHGGNHKMSKTSEVKVHCPGKNASCATRNVGVTESESQRAMAVIKEARAFKSDFPICTIIMKPSYTQKGRLVHVPMKFARDCLLMAGDKFVTLKDSTGKKRRVGYTTSPCASKVSLYNGWHEFVLENHLMVGDACVFELVDIANLEMKVNIIRAFPDIV